MYNCDFLPANHDDFTEIMGIYHSLIGTPGCTWCLEYPDEELVRSDIDSKSLCVLKENGKIIAVAAAGALDDTEDLRWDVSRPCELSRLGVISSRQGQGVGTFMLKSVMQTAKEKGFGGMILLVSKTNPAAIAMYEKCGFKRCGETFMYGNDYYCYQVKFAS